jgi:Ca2+-binding EF-hand superfamily protein
MSDFKQIAFKHFKKYDRNNDEKIEFSELRNLLNDVARDLEFPELEETEIQEIIKEFDQNKDKVISREEFIKLFEVLYLMDENLN